MSATKTPITVDAYIAQFPAEQQDIMQRVRAIVHEEAPQVEERMSWAMPTFFFHHNLVHFAMHKSHLGFYPGANGVAAFEDKLKDYHTSKGAIQFPMAKPMPYDLIREITAFRVKEEQAWAEKNKK